MHDHPFLAPAMQLQKHCTQFRAKQAELDDRLQRALAQLQHHRGETFQSKLKARSASMPAAPTGSGAVARHSLASRSLLLREYQATAKAPLQHELQFMRCAPPSCPRARAPVPRPPSHSGRLSWGFARRA
jgi:hypothetical protein